jgi:hypothetical protein
MMLLHVDTDDGDMLFMALPDGEAMYDGFVRAEFSEIPPSPNLLVADQLGHDELFRQAKVAP